MKVLKLHLLYSTPKAILLDATYNANAAESSSDDEIDVADDDALSTAADTPKFKNNNIQ
jgi:hypothetical protein